MEKPSWTNRRATFTPAALSRSASEKKIVPRDGKLVPGGGLALGEGQTEGGVDAHHFSGRAHLRAEQGVGAGEPGKRKDRFFDAHVPTAHGRAKEAFLSELLEGRAGHDPGSHLGQRNARRFRDEGDGAAGARVGLDHEHLTGPDVGVRPGA